MSLGVEYSSRHYDGFISNKSLRDLLDKIAAILALTQLRVFAHDTTRSELKRTEIIDKLTLRERINRYGKIRFLFICDENLGRSRIFAAAMNAMVIRHGLEDYVEVMSAGTDVEKKQSFNKFPDGLPPVVRTEIQLHGITEEQDRAKQLNDALVTFNTVAVMLNKPRKTRKGIRQKCLCTIDAQLKDPGRLKRKITRELDDVSRNAMCLCAELVKTLKKAIASDSVQMFENKKINIDEYYFDL